MDDSGAILCQISSLKDMLDQVNEEIEQNIQRTREIESEIVKCSEIEKDYLIRESNLMKMVSVGDFELNGFAHVAATARRSLDTIERELKLLKIYLDDTTKRISKKRENFIATCSNFQGNIARGENDELRILLSEKGALEDGKHNLSMKVNALQNSTKELITEILEEIHSFNAALEFEVQHGSSENRELLNNIDELKILICSVGPFEDASWIWRSYSSIKSSSRRRILIF